MLIRVINTPGFGFIFGWICGLFKELLLLISTTFSTFFFLVLFFFKWQSYYAVGIVFQSLNSVPFSNVLCGRR